MQGVRQCHVRVHGQAAAVRSRLHDAAVHLQRLFDRRGDIQGRVHAEHRVVVARQVQRIAEMREFR